MDLIKQELQAFYRWWQTVPKFYQRAVIGYCVVLLWISFSGDFQAVLGASVLYLAACAVLWWFRRPQPKGKSSKSPGQSIASRVMLGLVCFGGVLVTAAVAPPLVVPAVIIAPIVFYFGAFGNVMSEEERRRLLIERSARGRKLESHESADEKTLKLRDEDDPGVLWGKVRIPSSDAKWHFCVVGAVGSGKTLSIRTLMNDQLPRIIPGSDTRAMIYDAKQDMVQIVHSLKLPCPIVILNPFDKRASAWHLATDIDSPAAARQFALTLVPKESESQPFFSDAVRELLREVVTVFLTTRPGKWTFREVLLVMRSKDLIRQVLEKHPRSEQTMKNFLDVGDVTLGSIMATIATKLGPFEAIAAAWERAATKISIKKWLESESILILGNDERVRATLDTVNQVFVSITAQHALAMSESSTRTNWFFFDEFSEAGRLPGLESIILRGRSKGCCVVLGFQDIEHVNLVYKEKLGNTLVGQCGNKAFLRIESPETAEWASKCINDREAIEIQVTHSSGGRSDAYQRQTRPQVMPAQFMNLAVTSPENGMQGYYIIRSAGCFPATYTPYELNANLGTLDKSIIAYDPAPLDWQDLQPWTTADAIALGLVGASRSADDEPQELGGLESIGRIEL